MPSRPPRPCGWPGCPALTPTAYCREHTKTTDRKWRDRGRKQIYNSPRWRGLRRTVLKEQPWCNVPGCTNPTTDVDHITPLRDNGDPYNRNNLQGLCKKHHSEKTQREVFGRKG